MASYSLIMNQIDLDQEFYVWGSGQDLKRFNGTTWEYYDYTNSAVPSSYPYFLDTRCISIDNEDKAWLGCAQGPTAGLNEVAVFWVDTNDVLTGNSWNFSALGTFDQPQEISLVYSCPFGDDILAFSTPLNGIGGTASSMHSETIGVTGGRLFYYLKETDEWKETIPGYNWPHIYDIKAKGLDGKNYVYYVATSEGLFIIPPGTLETMDLFGGGKIIKQAKVFNTSTNGMPSDVVYSLDLDENGNLWMGTERGISYFDGKNFYNNLGGLKATKVKARPNGHVFFTARDGETHTGLGIYHWNGIESTLYSTSNTNLPNNDIIDIKLVKHNVKQENITVYEDSFWVLCYNDIAVFNYDQPHVYGSSKYEGATGWNFTYLSATGATLSNAPLPKVNKYTWTYPEWRVYQDEYLADKFPGLDPRDLFLTTSLGDIASGKAGKQEYWDNWPIPSAEDKVLEETILPPDFAYPITKYSGSGNLTITGSASIKTADGIKYYVSGYIEGDVVYSLGNFGSIYSTQPLYINNINPTLGGVGDYTNQLSSYSDGVMGFIASYGEEGNVETYLPFRGYKTYVDDIAPSDDGTYIVASGRYERFIEEGPYVWSSLASEVTDYYGGPDGAPVGLTTPFGSVTDYPWIVGATSSPYGSSTWLYSDGSTPPEYFSIDYTDQYFNQITAITLNYLDEGDNDQSYYLQIAVTGNVIQMDLSPFSSAYYRINGIVPVSSDSIRYDVSWVYGCTAGFSGYLGEGVSEASFTFYDYTPTSYPQVPNLISRTTDWDSGLFDPTGIFVAKIGRDLGRSVSLADLNDEHSRRLKYRGFNFRNFPATYISTNSWNGGPIKVSVDLTEYSINATITVINDFNANFDMPGGLSTLKNLWNRSGDYDSVPVFFLDSSNEIATNCDTDSTVGYLRLSTEDMTLFTAASSKTDYPNPLLNSYIDGSSINSLRNDSTTLITGMTSNNFTLCGIYLNSPNLDLYNVSLPYYLIVDKNGIGVTGGIINVPGYSDLYYNGSSITATSDGSTYYIASNGFGDGDFMGNTFSPDDKYSQYLLTSRVTEQGIPMDFTYTLLGLSSNAGRTTIIKTQIDSDNMITTYGYNSFISIGSSRPINIMKTNLSGRITSQITFGNILSTDTFTNTTDPDGNIFMFGYNYSGFRQGFGYYVTGTSRGFSLRSKKHVAKTGINLGQIISRPGSGAWTWCDVHSTDKGMEIPLMTTVVFSNYASELYGKENNIWILSDSATGEQLLDVKGTPYFIYTFTSAGNYTIYNSVEDSEGNVYTTSKPGYIQVIDHKVKKDYDPNPDYVDSFDYGQPIPFPGRDYEAHKLAKDLEKAQAQFYNSEQVPFGSEFSIIHNPDATFRTDI
jgi:hypothetical protein